MKRLLLNKIIPTLLLGAVLVFNSCKKDELESKEMLVYVAGEYASVSNTIKVPYVHNPAAITGNGLVSFVANTTREVPAAVTVTFKVDETLVTDYNTKNGTSCLLLPQANYRLTTAVVHTIAPGALASDSMKIEILNPQNLTDPRNYVLPVTISGIDSKDKGMVISSNQKTVYLNVTYEYNNVLATQVPLNGTLPARTGWSVTVSNTTAGALGPAMIDNNNSTAWRSSNSSTAVKWAIVNMGSQQTIKGFQVVPNYVAVAENATQMTISTSNDNINWVVQGAWKGTGPATGSSATAPDIKGINFASPVQAQYFRFDITALVSGSRVGIGEVNIVQ